MSRDSSGSYLSAVFVDYDNIYLSLKKKSEEAAKRFSKDASRWVRAIESGKLITPTNGLNEPVQRRLVLNRCYGNPVPRRNQTDTTSGKQTPRRNPSDNSTDMSSFPFVRHHFLRGGFEIIDCPPLTAQLKNSADIRIVMDIRDFLTHETYFDEFIVLSSDADFTPLLHRLRAHARHTIVFSNDHTAAPYSALCDGEIRESDLLDLLVENQEITVEEKPALVSPTDLAETRDTIIAEVVRSVLSASAPQPLEALAERAIRVLGHAKTVGTDWGGAGNFRDLLSQNLPANVSLTEQAPYFAYDVSRAIARSDTQRIAPPAATPAATTPLSSPLLTPNVTPPEPLQEIKEAAPAQQAEASSDPVSSDRAVPLQESIALIHQACQAPPLSPPEYRTIFNLLADEIGTHQMQGHQTIDKVRAAANELDIDVQRDDIRFIIDVVGKQDPWFEQGTSALVFASRFRNFVIGKCQDAGMSLSADEIDLIDAWFAGGNPVKQPAAAAAPTAPPLAEPRPGEAAASSPLADASSRLEERTARWWQETTAARDYDVALTGESGQAEEFPRIVRNRLKA